ncbi:hypothetical protein [Anaeroselena agilis]|uniref:Uncharacterized protein n=1 Tax=Anaeroselena agilis TaxID=3063788 RepID=A0ABU3NW19_9FIRM|nr:hypothetical protein [Selenomonadales bacterium 4137-cl]
MWMLLPALSLAIVHIAGDNAGVVPDAAARAGAGICLTVVLAYLVFGAGLTGLAAWIGARAGVELAVVVRRLFGASGKRLFGAITLGISIPASALTGGYFAALLVRDLTGLPLTAATPLCLAFFALMAAGYLPELLIFANYCSLLLVPAVILLFVLSGGYAPLLNPLPMTEIDWPLAMALLGYNAGGMRPALAAETAACLARRGGRAVWLTVAAKLLEGVLTVAMVYIVIAAGVAGPMSLTAAAACVFGPAGGRIFAGVLLCTFVTTMVPAMVVNGRHLACCTGIATRSAVAAAAFVVYLATFLSYGAMLTIMAWMAGATSLFIGYTAYKVHKNGVNQQ